MYSEFTDDHPKNLGVKADKRVPYHKKKKEKMKKKKKSELDMKCSINEKFKIKKNLKIKAKNNKMAFEKLCNLKFHFIGI